MFNLFWRKKYERNLEAYKDYLINDYKYIDYYKNRIKEIIEMTPYTDMNYKLKFDELKTLEIYFYKDNYRARVLISADSFEHYEWYTEEYKTLSENVRNSYKRSLTEALMGLENEYVKEMEISFQRYMNRIDSFLKNIDQEIKR
jgi:PHD/YefM family antitoxin component YafN of YafNO toxin-antitoxin module